MSIAYHVYWNGGSGPVNFAAPIGSTAALTFDLPPVGSNADVIAVVRAYDTVTGYEDANNDARVEVRLDEQGNDVTSQPNAPTAVTAIAGVGAAKLSWLYNAGGQGGAPHQFRVYAWTDGSPANYTTPALTAAYHGSSPGRPYRTTLALAAGTWRIGIRAANAIEEKNTRTVRVVVSASGPAAVQSLTATATP